MNKSSSQLELIKIVCVSQLKIHEPTLRCMLKTVQYIMQNAEHLLSDAKNSSHAKIECMVNELYIEGFFGNITQSLTVDSADLHDYVYRKRKIEISSIIKIVQKALFSDTIRIRCMLL